ncbi:Os02g0578000, partial [Oryza sativa Japonica Group]
MVAKRNPGTPATAAAPRERMRRRWLYSVLTNVTWKPLQWSTLASFIIGVTCPCAGNGRHTACGLISSAATMSSYVVVRRSIGWWKRDAAVYEMQPLRLQALHIYTTSVYCYSSVGWYTPAWPGSHR